MASRLPHRRRQDWSSSEGRTQVHQVHVAHALIGPTVKRLHWGSVVGSLLPAPFAGAPRVLQDVHGHPCDHGSPPTRAARNAMPGACDFSGGTGRPRRDPTAPPRKLAPRHGRPRPPRRKPLRDARHRNGQSTPTRVRRPRHGPSSGAPNRCEALWPARDPGGRTAPAIRPRPRAPGLSSLASKAAASPGRCPPNGEPARRNAGMASYQPRS